MIEGFDFPGIAEFVSVVIPFLKQLQLAFEWVWYCGIECIRKKRWCGVYVQQFNESEPKPLNFWALDRSGTQAQFKRPKFFFLKLWARLIGLLILLLAQRRGKEVDHWLKFCDLWRRGEFETILVRDGKV